MCRQSAIPCTECLARYPQIYTMGMGGGGGGQERSDGLLLVLITKVIARICMMLWRIEVWCCIKHIMQTKPRKDMHLSVLISQWNRVESQSANDRSSTNRLSTLTAILVTFYEFNFRPCYISNDGHFKN